MSAGGMPESLQNTAILAFHVRTQIGQRSVVDTYFNVYRSSAVASLTEQLSHTYLVFTNLVVVG